MMATSLDCPICLVPFDDLERRPLRTFCRCKQALCEPCLVQLLQHGNQCPWDRTRWIGRNLIQKFIFATPPNFFQSLQQKAATEELQQQEKKLSSKKDSIESKSTSELVAEEDVDQQIALLLMLQEEKEIAQKRKQEEEDLLFAKQLLQSEVKTRIELNPSSNSQKNPPNNNHNVSNERGHSQTKPPNSQSKAINVVRHQSNNIQRFLAAANSSSSSGSIPFQVIDENAGELCSIKTHDNNDVNNYINVDEEEDICIVISPNKSQAGSATLPHPSPTMISQSQPHSIKKTLSTTNNSNHSKHSNGSLSSSNSQGILSFLSVASQPSVSLISPVKKISVTGSSNNKMEKPLKNPILEGIERMKSLPPRNPPSNISFNPSTSKVNPCKNNARSSSNGIDWDTHEASHPDGQDTIEDLTQWESSEANSPSMTEGSPYDATDSDTDFRIATKKQWQKNKRKLQFSAYENNGDDEYDDCWPLSSLRPFHLSTTASSAAAVVPPQRRKKRLKPNLWTNDEQNGEVVDDELVDEDCQCVDGNKEKQAVRGTKALLLSQSSQDQEGIEDEKKAKRLKKHVVLSDEEDDD